MQACLNAGKTSDVLQASSCDQQGCRQTNPHAGRQAGRQVYRQTEIDQSDNLVHALYSVHMPVLVVRHATQAGVCEILYTKNCPLSKAHLQTDTHRHTQTDRQTQRHRHTHSRVVSAKQTCSNGDDPLASKASTHFLHS